MTPDGRALFQGRETPGVEGDCRFVYRFPADGAVRDPGPRQPLRRDRRRRLPAPRDRPSRSPPGLFPLGGPPGRPVAVTASGGNLTTPVSQTVDLPDQPGAIVDVPPFDGPGGRPRRRAGSSSATGPSDRVGRRASRPLPAGRHGQRPDRPAGRGRSVPVAVKAGETVRSRSSRPPLGSWLDSVVDASATRGASSWPRTTTPAGPRLGLDAGPPTAGSSSRPRPTVT